MAVTLSGVALSNHVVFYQVGENTHRDVFLMMQKDIPVIRVSYFLLNISVINLLLSEAVRLVASYALTSKI